MSCPTDDLKDLLLGELSGKEADAVRAHAARCAACRAELEQLDLTAAMLRSMADEEPPRRIAFVSDKVFEPRWWERIWHSGPIMGFASAVLLAAAIVTHGYARPAQIATAAPPAPVEIEKRVQAEVNRRVSELVPAMVEKAVAAASEKQQKETLRLIAIERKQAGIEAKKEYAAVIRGFVEQAEYDRKRNREQTAVARRASYDTEVPR